MVLRDILEEIHDELMTIEGFTGLEDLSIGGELQDVAEWLDMELNETDLHQTGILCHKLLMDLMDRQN